MIHYFSIASRHFLHCFMGTKHKNIKNCCLKETLSINSAYCNACCSNILTTTLSAFYGKLLVVLGLALPVTSAIIPESTATRYDVSRNAQGCQHAILLNGNAIIYHVIYTHTLGTLWTNIFIMDLYIIKL
jgi:hypothetical protein